MRKFAAAVVSVAAATGLVFANTGTANAITDHFGAGWWHVHEDIYTGIYEARNPSDWLTCRVDFYNRDINQVGHYESVNQRVRLTVGWNDYIVSTSSGCGMWTRVGDVAPPPPPAPADFLTPLLVVGGLGSAMVGSTMLPGLLTMGMMGSAAAY